MRFSSLEDTISPDNQVRFIDVFVEYIDLSKLHFAVKTLKTEGRPSFNSIAFLKTYLYGYVNVKQGHTNVRSCESIILQRGVNDLYNHDLRKAIL